MKKLILLSTLLSLVYFAQSQTPSVAGDASSENKLRLGLHITPTLGFITSDKPAIKNGGARLGYNWGMVFDVKFADNYYFSTGFNLINSPIKINFVDTLRDTSSTSTNSLSNVDLKYKLQYLGIPLTLKLKTKEVNYMKYYVLFGVEPQFNISKKVNANKGRYAGAEYNLPSQTAYANFNDDISFARIALVIGGGVEYSLGGKTALTGGISYNSGFSDINKDKNTKITNSYVALNLGILF
ncbi:MAG: porin family protein [Bacteroidetes bacterium]|nr:porin family protein [Bacteroidota bacterium]